MSVVSKYKPLSHYNWGQDCDGRNLVDEGALSIKQEKMPPATSEKVHYHNKAQQFFYILRGVAEIEIDRKSITLNTGEGLHIKAGISHRILNPGTEDLEFILCSTPSTTNDRINC